MRKSQFVALRSQVATWAGSEERLARLEKHALRFYNWERNGERSKLERKVWPPGGPPASRAYLVCARLLREADAGGDTLGELLRGMLEAAPDVVRLAGMALTEAMEGDLAGEADEGGPAHEAYRASQRRRRALWGVVEASRKKKEEGGSDPSAAAAALSVLTVALEPMAGRDLSGVRVPGAWLQGVSLDGADLRGANLSRAQLDHASLTGARLEGAKLHNIVQVKRVLRGHATEVTAVSWSPGGVLLASASDDGSVRVWNVSTGTEVQRVVRRRTLVAAVAWSPSGTRLASTSGASVLVLNPYTGREVMRMDGHRGVIWAVSWSPDGTRLASASLDQSVRVWDVSTGAEVLRLDGHTDWARDVSWSPGGTRLASASCDKSVRVWDASTGAEVLRLDGHTGAVHAVSWSPDGAKVASASADRSVRVWDASTGAEVLQLRGHNDEANTVMWSRPSGTRLASASSDKSVRVWDASTGAEVRRLKGHTDVVNAVSWSPNGVNLASASGDSTLRVWDADLGGRGALSRSRRTAADAGRASSYLTFLSCTVSSRHARGSLCTIHHGGGTIVGLDDDRVICDLIESAKASGAAAASDADVDALLSSAAFFRGRGVHVVPELALFAHRKGRIASLDLRDNLIDYCPVELVNFDDVRLEGNPLPPQLLSELERGGWPAARAYLRALVGGGGLVAPEAARLLLLGNEATGKTVLSASLPHAVSAFDATFRAGKLKADVMRDVTSAVTVSTLTRGGVRWRLVDHPGQAEYYATNGFFSQSLDCAVAVVMLRLLAPPDDTLSEGAAREQLALAKRDESERRSLTRAAKVLNSAQLDFWLRSLSQRARRSHQRRACPVLVLCSFRSDAHAAVWKPWLAGVRARLVGAEPAPHELLRVVDVQAVDANSPASLRVVHKLLFGELGPEVLANAEPVPRLLLDTVHVLQKHRETDGAAKLLTLDELRVKLDGILSLIVFTDAPDRAAELDNLFSLCLRFLCDTGEAVLVDGAGVVATDPAWVGELVSFAVSPPRLARKVRERLPNGPAPLFEDADDTSGLVPAERLHDALAHPALSGGEDGRQLARVLESIGVVFPAARHLAHGGGGGGGGAVEALYYVPGVCTRTDLPKLRLPSPEQLHLGLQLYAQVRFVGAGLLPERLLGRVVARLRLLCLMARLSAADPEAPPRDPLFVRTTEEGELAEAKHDDDLSVVEPAVAISRNAADLTFVAPGGQVLARCRVSFCVEPAHERDAVVVELLAPGRVAERASRQWLRLLVSMTGVFVPAVREALVSGQQQPSVAAQLPCHACIVDADVKGACPVRRLRADKDTSTELGSRALVEGGPHYGRGCGAVPGGAAASAGLAMVMDRPPGLSGFYFDLFLSHRGPDTKRALAAPLAAVLKRHGLKVFLDEDADDTLRQAWGGDVTEELARGLYGSRRVLCLLSPHFHESVWCLRELHTAVQRDRDEDGGGKVVLTAFCGGLEPAALHERSEYTKTGVDGTLHGRWSIVQKADVHANTSAFGVDMLRALVPLLTNGESQPSPQQLRSEWADAVGDTSRAAELRRELGVVATSTYVPADVSVRLEKADSLVALYRDEADQALLRDQ